MEITNIILNENEVEILRNCIGNKLIKYRVHQADDVSLTMQHLQIFINNKIYDISNELEPQKYWGDIEDVSSLHIKEIDKPLELHFPEQYSIVDTLIDDTITNVYLVNERQIQYTNDVATYEMNYTKGIIFKTSKKDVAFLKEEWDLDEQFDIYVGKYVYNDIMDNYTKIDDDLKETDGVVVKIERNIHEII